MNIPRRFLNGKVELLEAPPTSEDARVVVTFLPREGKADLASRGIDAARAADLRARLKPLADDWNRSEMDVYD